MPKAKKEVPIIIPDAVPEIKKWIILGLDPSLSRTGYAMMSVQPGIVRGTSANWLLAGSVKSDSIENGMHPRNTIWLRAKLMALYLRGLVEQKIRVWQENNTDLKQIGLIISMEYPTPMNDYLVALNRVIHLTFFENTLANDSLGALGRVQVMYTNAATLRSLMSLTARGAKNKAENIARAYDFIGKDRYPELDTDSCDAVLLSMMGRHAASIMMGWSVEVPEKVFNSLCNATQEVKGSGRNQHVVTKGLLHRNEYWYKYERQGYDACIKDASNPKKSLARMKFYL